MSLPAVQSPVWQRLASGALARIRTENLALQLMAKRLERSPATPAQKAAEVHAYFTKWERVLQQEIQQFASL